MDAYIGEIKLFAGNFAPENWAICDGRMLPVNGYEMLYSLIGFTYGRDGEKFALPDLREKVVVGTGQLANGSNYRLGESGGEKEVTLTLAEMPAHNHKLMATTEAADTGNPVNTMLAKSNPVTTSIYQNVKAYGKTHTGSSNFQLDQDSVSNAGNNKAHNNEMPYITLNYIICIKYALYPDFG
jgi:microcystin-dependent protein